jgi:TetR/AcrR family transcriptional regulator, tetracycline repressor protein
MTTGNRSGRPGRRAILEVEQVIDAALAILDADGLEGVSFRRVSADLGVSHMTLYGYFDSKEALLEALVARTIAVPWCKYASASSGQRAATADRS